MTCRLCAGHGYVLAIERATRNEFLFTCQCSSVQGSHKWARTVWTDASFAKFRPIAEHELPGTVCAAMAAGTDSEPISRPSPATRQDASVAQPARHWQDTD